jgi:hypothetical protein
VDHVDLEGDPDADPAGVAERGFVRAQAGMGHGHRPGRDYRLMIRRVVTPGYQSRTRSRSTVTFALA